MDAFYVSVERQRLGRDDNASMAVQQWSSLIAVDYNCRKFKVKRGMKAEDAMKLCPDLECVHVELIGGCNEKNGKVSLERYRAASKNVMRIFESYSKKNGFVLERASIDEAYFDLTKYVEKHLSAGVVKPFEEEKVLEYTNVVSNLNPYSFSDRGLIVASALVYEIRQEVKKKLGYPCSAGISVNKLLAKVASSRNKPNKQTIVPFSAKIAALENLPLKGIPGLGGKVGDCAVAALTGNPENEISCGEAASMLLKTDANVKLDPSTLSYVRDRVRGICLAPVVAKMKSKSLLALKSFSAVHSTDGLNHWLSVLCKELEARVSNDMKENNRRPTTLIYYHRVLYQKTSSVRLSFIRGKYDHESIEALARKAIRRLDKLWPCSRIGVGAENFENLPKPGEGLEKFLVKKTTTTTTPCSFGTSPLQITKRPKLKGGPKLNQKPRGLEKFIINMANKKNVSTSKSSSSQESVKELHPKRKGESAGDGIAETKKQKTSCGSSSSSSSNDAALISKDDEEENLPWTCEVCTFLNPGLFLACGVCSSLKQ